MHRLATRSTLLSLLLVVFIAGNASAATANVSMTDNVFTPQAVTIKVGDSVMWTNDGATVHTSTGDAPLSRWDSGTVAVGDSFTFAFTAGGTYPYHCTFHQDLGMIGTVKVKIMASPPSGPVGTQFTITVASVQAPLPFHYDIMKKNPGEPFKALFSIRATSFIFDSTGQPPGKYQFKSRLRNADTMAKSAFSPARSITVTP
jgi:plastocyanin